MTTGAEELPWLEGGHQFRNLHLNQETYLAIQQGMVHVHDDLPFDKAQVIMHLAGSGNNISRSGSGAFSPARPLSALTAVPQLVTPMLGSTAPQAPTPSTAGLTCRIIPGVMRRAPTANVELPQARKASLARFVEKRKDRVPKLY